MKYYQCYYCPFQTDEEEQYVAHGVRTHPFIPLFPGEADLAKRKLTPQGKPWEKYNITLAEAEKRLALWAAKGNKSTRKKYTNS
jgi:hypothetical protein